MPDLINTSDDLDDYGSRDTVEKQDEIITLKSNLLSPLGDDLFGIDPVVNVSTANNSNPDDPFSDVSFHVTDEKEQNDLFSGLPIDNQKPGVALNIPEGNKPDPFDIFSSTSGHFQEETGKDAGSLHNLMNDLTIHESKHEAVNASGNSLLALDFLNHNGQPSQVFADAAIKRNLCPPVYPQTPMQYGMPPNIMFNQSFVSQPMDYSAMSALIAQQQFLLQNLGYLNPECSHVARTAVKERNSAPLPDIFQHTNNPVQNNASALRSPKEDTKAFNFVSEEEGRDPEAWITWLQLEVPRGIIEAALNLELESHGNLGQR